MCEEDPGHCPRIQQSTMHSHTTRRTWIISNHHFKSFATGSLTENGCTLMQVKLQEKKKGVDSLASKIAAVQKECNMIFDDVSPHHPVKP